MKKIEFLYFMKKKFDYRYMKKDVYISIMYIVYYIYCIKFFID